MDVATKQREFYISCGIFLLVLMCIIVGRVTVWIQRPDGAMLSVFGTGAVILAAKEWRRARQEQIPHADLAMGTCITLMFATGAIEWFW